MAPEGLLSAGLVGTGMSDDLTPGSCTADN